MQFKNLAVPLLGLMWTLQAFAETSTFSPTQGVEAALVLEGSTLNIAVKGETHNESRTIDFQAENELHVQVDDFNFDGAKDFAVRQLDDGMGTYATTGYSFTKPERAPSKSYSRTVAMASLICVSIKNVKLCSAPIGK